MVRHFYHLLRWGEQFYTHAEVREEQFNNLLRCIQVRGTGRVKWQFYHMQGWTDGWSGVGGQFNHLPRCA